MSTPAGPEVLLRLGCEFAAGVHPGPLAPHHRDAFTVALPLPSGVSAPVRLAADGCFVEDGREGRRLAAGEALRLETRGPGRLERLAAGLRVRWRVPDAGVVPAPVLFCGFVFTARDCAGGWAGFLEACVVLPREELCSRGEAVVLYLSAGAGEWKADSDAVRARWIREVRGLAADLGVPTGPPAPAGLVGEAPGLQEWARRLHRAQRAMVHTELHKPDLLRRQSWAGLGFHPGRQMVVRSRCGGEGGVGVGYAVRFGNALLLGCSPERLVEVTGDEVLAKAVAGTVPVAAMRCLSKRRLVAGYEWVVETIVRALHELSGGPVRSAPRAVRRVGGLAHWCRRLSVDGSAGTGDPLKAACALHPTSAVAGFPRQAAVTWLRRRDGLGRGWYGGCVGWMVRRGRGVLHVALRAALMLPGRAELFAGAGVWPGSHVGEEWRETGWKLKQVARLLGLDRSPALAVV